LRLRTDGIVWYPKQSKGRITQQKIYEGWNFNSGNYLFTTDTK